MKRFGVGIVLGEVEEALHSMSGLLEQHSGGLPVALKQQ